MKKAVLLLTAALISVSAIAAKINRKAVVTRNNPHITSLDTLGSLTVGNGHFAYTVDITGLQSFPDFYANGIPLCTMSDWGWHSFPNTGRYKPEEALKDHNFNRGHKQELYSSEFRQAGRQKDASDYLRANPHRLNLADIGFDFATPADIQNINQSLDMWNGIINSRFTYQNKRYDVKTLCLPDRDKIAAYIKSDGPIAIRLRIPYPTGKHSDNASDWSRGKNMKTAIVAQGANFVSLKVDIDSTSYYITVDWKGVVGIKANYNNDIVFTAKGKELTIGYAFTKKKPLINAKFSWLRFDALSKLTSGYWHKYWSEGGMIDFSHVADKRAKELERRTLQSLYLLAVNDGQDYPPAETGLTYNSWFGKYHLEMIYWHQAYQALWGHSEQLEHTLSWYLKAEPMAREIARRQGFKGVRWMKMTDPSAAEAPSNVGSYLIWQQPHLIYLAELLYRAGNKEVIKKYGKLVEETTEFMSDFAEFDSTRNQYILRGYIPAQETLKADSVVNSPFELSYWLSALKIAQQWLVRQGLPRNEQWDDLIEKLAPLPEKNGIYLTSEKSPLIDHQAEQTDNPSGPDKFASDHPMPLGAFGMMPDSRLFTHENMKKTYDWIIKNWNWQKTWGWDYPMTAMCAVRLNQPEDAVNALLMNVPKNTYLVQGHNWQTNRLRIYLPGNGGLLTTIALMTAGWDGCTQKNPGFPQGWDVRWEGILPLP